MFGPTHSRYVPPVSRAPASELVLQRGVLPSEIALPGETSSPKLCIEGWVPTLKNKKNIFSANKKNIFSANNEQGCMKRGEKWFSENFEKTFDLENVRSDSFSIRTSRIESFRARVAKGSPASEIALPGEASSPPPPL